MVIAGLGKCFKVQFWQKKAWDKIAFSFFPLGLSVYIKGEFLKEIFLQVLFSEITTRFSIINDNECQNLSPNKNIFLGKWNQVQN